MSPLHRFARALLNILCPPQCPLCRAEGIEPHCLCPACFEKLKFITPPYCAVCGRPFEFSALGGNTCGSCLRRKPPYRKARSILAYDSASKPLILAFKHGDHLELRPLLVKLLLQAESALFQEADAIVPVPLHRSRLIWRKYNQAGLLALELARRLKKPYLPHCLARTRATSSQGHLRRQQRIRNVAKAFSVRKPELIQGKRVLLIDDVMTSGATAEACARALKKGGAKEVSVLTLLRLLRS